VDEKGGARMLEQSTENTNYSCVFTVVSNAFIGLECSEHTCYDFIIVRKDMQHLGAIDMLNVLKAVGCPTPLVVLLDEHDNCSDYDSNALGFFAALRKPLSTKILCTLIEAIVNRYTAALSSSGSSSHSSSSSSNLDISSNSCIENQAISLSDQRSSNDGNLNNEQHSTSVPVLENPRKGKGKSLKSKSLKATVSSAKSLNKIDATIPTEKKSREEDDYADDMRAEKDEENIDYNKNIVIVKESHRGSSNISMQPDRG
jgi:DNA-binding response OmpR family regulator